MAGLRKKHLFRDARKGKTYKKVPKTVRTFVKREIVKHEQAQNVVATSWGYTSSTLMPVKTQNVTLLCNPASPSISLGDAIGIPSAPSGGYSQLIPCGRVTDYMRWNSIHIKMQVGHGGQLARPTTTFRVILYIDKMCKATQPNVNQIVDPSDYVYGVYNTASVDFAKRFKILYDKTYTLVPKNTLGISGSPGATTNSSDCVNIDIKKKLNVITDYSRGTPSAGNYTNIDSGAICLGLMSDDAGTYGSPIQLDYLNMAVNLEGEAYAGRGMRKV